MTNQSENQGKSRQSKQSELLSRLLGKYDLRGVRLDDKAIKCTFIVLGVTYGLDEKDICSYIDLNTKDILKTDIAMLSKVFDIPFPDGLEGDTLVRTFKERVVAMRMETKVNDNDHTHDSKANTNDSKKADEPDKYERLTRLLLEPGMARSLNTFKLEIINDAIKTGVEEAYLIELINKGYEARELQRLIELYRLTHGTATERKKHLKR